jgi:hypothetical protein
VTPIDLQFKQHEDSQLSLDIFSEQEQLENLQNPRYFNQRRFEIKTKNETLFFHAPDEQIIKVVLNQYGISDYTIKQVRRLTKRELEI